MKIMLITQLPPPSGGIATWSKHYIDYCKKNDVDLTIVNNAVIGDRVNALHGRISLITEIKRTFLVLKDIIKKKAKFKPTHIHFNTTCSPLGIIRDYIYIVFIGKEIPIYLHCRCSIEFQLNNNKIGKFFFKKAVQRSSVILVLNESSKKYVEKISDSTLYKIPNFIEDTFLANHPHTVAEDIKNIIYIGHVRITKGFFEIVEAAKTFPEIIFHLIGAIDDECKISNLPDNLFLLGEKSPQVIKNELDNSDIFLFPTYSEGFSNALLEAMARGLPIITTNVGANEDMIESNGGVILDSLNPEDIEHAIKMLRDKETRKLMSDWNINKVKQVYLIDKVMETILSIYQETSNK